MEVELWASLLGTAAIKIITYIGVRILEFASSCKRLRALPPRQPGQCGGGGGDSGGLEGDCWRRGCQGRLDRETGQYFPKRPTLNEGPTWKPRRHRIGAPRGDHKCWVAVGFRVYRLRV